MRLLAVTTILLVFSFSGLCTMQQPGSFPGVKKLTDKQLLRLERISRKNNENALLFAALVELQQRRERKKNLEELSVRPIWFSE